MNFDTLFKLKKPITPRPKQWRVTFYREDGKMAFGYFTLG
ncbi:hypothetical protein RCH09_001925 [Actimicrobium sp. GrIS 1.19]|nr:hypothetical protein [Actimicrobium sp. GrIS 1.19]